MRGLRGNWRVWMSLLGLGLVGVLIATGSATAHSFLATLTRSLLGQSSDPSMQTQGPIPPAVDVGGPSTAGPVQLVDMTGRYEKVDLHIQNSTGPFVFKRTFRTSLGYWAEPQGTFSVQPQWWNNLTGAASYDVHDLLDHGITCLPGGNCPRHADFYVDDPDTGTVLTYYSTTWDAGTPVPETGFQIPSDAASTARLYVNAPGGNLQGFILFKPTGHYYFNYLTSPGRYSLTRIEDTKYADDGGITIANINYSGNNNISSVTTADGVVLTFTSDAGRLQAISIDGGKVVSYSYNSAGLLEQVFYPETGEGEIYSYGTNSNAFSASTLTGRKLISYVVDAGSTAGMGAVSSQTTEETTLAITGWYYDSVSCAQGSMWCYNHTLQDPYTTAGDGSALDGRDFVALNTAYTLTEPRNPSGAAWGLGTGPQTSATAANCNGCAGLLPSDGGSWQFFLGRQGANPGTHEGQPPYAQWSVNNDNLSFSVYPGAGPTTSSSVPVDAGFYPPIEYPNILRGANDSNGSGALSSQNRTYGYGGVGQHPQGYEQLVSTVQQPSTLVAFTPTATTYYNWDTTHNRLRSVVRSGATVNSGALFPTAVAYIGTIYNYDSLGRVVKVLGPCFVGSTNTPPPTGCVAGWLAPTVSYVYWPAGNSFKSNRLNTKTVCTSSTPGAECSTTLVTTYTEYDARGHVTSSTDPNGVVTTFKYAGDHLVQQVVGNTDTTNYGYDEDQLTWVQHPSKMVDFMCHRVGATLGNCPINANTLPLSKYVYWKAKCTDTSCGTMTESVAYQYTHGFVYKETYYDKGGNVRRVVRHDRDPRNHPTFDATGDTGTTYATRGMFDNDGNQVAIGFPYNAPSTFCGQGGDTVTCAQMSYDKLDRLVTLTEPPAGVSQLTATYDVQGNVSSISYDGQKVLYQYDDFGNLLTLFAPWLGNGSGSTIFYAYDAQGHIIAKTSPGMSAWEILQYDYDAAGRPLDLKDSKSGVATTLWALSYDASAAQASGCPPPGSASFTNGRVQLRTDSFGETWYTYNFRGQVTAESGVRSGATGCLPVETSFLCQAASNETNPNTVYFYTGAGLLSSIQYPHGRGVAFSYGSDGDTERVSTVSAGLNVGGTCGMYQLLSNITWEPYGGIRGYEVDQPTRGTPAQAAVEYLLGDDSSAATMTSCSSPSRPVDSTSDHTGRLRALWVSTGAYVSSSPAGTGNIFARQYAWQADQLTTQATCLLQTSGTPLTENFFSGVGSAGYNARLQLEHASRPAGGMKAAGGAWGQRDYGYDSRGNRISETTDCWSWADGYTNDQLTSRTLTGSTCSGTCEAPPAPFLTTNYTYDFGGRVQTLTSPSDSVGPSLYLSFNATIDGQAAVGSVYKSITVNDSSSAPLTFEYYYDANGRRRLKSYPDGEQDEYFYDLDNSMLEDHENCPSCGTNTLDEYVWLGGQAVILIRGSLSSSGMRNADFAGTCADFGNCGVYFPVTDYLGKPVLMLDSSLLVAGAADYDPFGDINRVMGAGDTQHPYTASPINPTTGAPEAQVVAGFRQTVPAGASYSIIARVRLAMVDTDSAASAYASLTDLQVATLLKYPVGSGSVGNVGGPHSGAQTTDWGIVPNASSSFPWQFQARFTAASASTRPGIAVAGYEYRKYQSGSIPTWFPLRFPGQYYDAETDLFQNWNRFYDANTGRYLEPEPLWLYPEKLVPLAAKGRSTPVYAYAGNNPINSVDMDGRAVAIFDGPDSSEINSYLDGIYNNANDPLHEAVVNMYASDTLVAFSGGQNIGAFNGATAQNQTDGSIFVKLSSNIDFAKTPGATGTSPIFKEVDQAGQSHDASFDSILAHEIGHASTALEGWGAYHRYSNYKAIEFGNYERAREGLPLLDPLWGHPWNFPPPEPFQTLLPASTPQPMPWAPVWIR